MKSCHWQMRVGHFRQQSGNKDKWHPKCNIYYTCATAGSLYIVASPTIRGTEIRPRPHSIRYSDSVRWTGRGPTRTEDQNKQKFSIHVENNLGPTVATPEGKIRAFCSYSCVYVAKTLDAAPFRYRKIDAPNSLSL